MLGIPTVTIVKESVETGSATVATDADGLLNSATNSITMTVDTSMLSFTPRHLLVRLNIRHNSADDGIYMKLNADSGSNYNNQNLQATDGTQTAARNTNNSSGVGLWKADDEAYEFSGGEFLIVDAFNTTTHKNVIGIGGVDHDHGLWLKYCRWADTSAVTSVAISTSAGNDMAADSYFELCVVDEAYNIDEEILTGSSNSFDISGITQANGHLVAIGNLRSDRASNDSDSLEMHYGTGSGSADTTATNYERQRGYGTGTTTAASNDNDDGFAKTTGATATANAFSAFVHSIPNYSDGSNFRTAMNLSGFHADSSKSDVYMESRTWRNAGGIDSFTLKPEAGSNFIAGSMLSTYRIPNDSKLIARVELSGTAANVNFSSIPTDYDHFEVISYMRVDRSSTSHFSQRPINGEGLESAGDSAAQFMAAFGSGFYNDEYLDNAGFMWGNANNAAANHFGVGVMTVLNYQLTDRHKWMIGTFGATDADSSDAGIVLLGSRYRSTNAINEFEYNPNNASFSYMAGTTVELRGISSTIPVGSDVDKVNGIALGDIESFNGVTPANAEKLNAIDF